MKIAPRLLLFFLLSIGQSVSAQKDIAKNLLSLQLQTLEQKIFSFDEIKNNTATVFVFLLPDCPSCQSYSLKLNQLSTKFNSSGIKFYGIFPGHYNTEKEMVDFQKRYRINFPLMIDPEKKLVHCLSAKVVPEVFVIDKAGKVLYHGRIDDWMYAVGKTKPGITKHELKDALDAVAQHQLLKVKETKAIGCIIE